MMKLVRRAVHVATLAPSNTCERGLSAAIAGVVLIALAGIGAAAANGDRTIDEAKAEARPVSDGRPLLVAAKVVLRDGAKARTVEFEIVGPGANMLMRDE